MPTIELGTGEQQRTVGKLPHIQIRNLYPEPDKTNASTGVTFLQRPGLAPFTTVGAGPINTVFRQLGTFKGDHLVVSKNQWFRVNSAGVSTLLGPVADGRGQVAASATRAIMASGGTAWSTDGTTVTTVVIPDGQQIGSVAFISGFFVLTILNSQRVFWIEPGQTDPDALSFFEAERAPDAITTAAVVGDELWLLGQETEEVWQLTGDIDAPFTRINARAYENGCAARDSLVHFDGALAWVTADSRVVIAQGSPSTVSTPAITEHLRNTDPTTMRSWFFKLDTHLFYILTSFTDTFVYDAATQTWCRWSSGISDLWRAHLGFGSICGDSASNVLWKIDALRANDAGLPCDRRITGGVGLSGPPQRANSVSINLAAGWAPDPNVQPQIEIRYSDDSGATWSEWMARGLGAQGRYDAAISWRKLGMIRAPGRLFEWRCTSDALLVVKGADLNDVFA